LILETAAFDTKWKYGFHVAAPFVRRVMPRRKPPKEKLITAAELKQWVRVYLIPSFRQTRKSLPPSVVFSRIAENGSSATFLAAVHTQSADIYAAKTSLLAVVRASRGRIDLVDSSGMLYRGDKTIEGWANELVSACRDMDVDPKNLGSLSCTFSTLYVF
jgi:hypothetical protein